MLSFLSPPPPPPQPTTLTIRMPTRVSDDNRPMRLGIIIMVTSPFAKILARIAGRLVHPSPLPPERFSAPRP